MKKGLLLVLAVLLVAGLFVSCNSDVSANAGASSKDLAYISFDNSGAKVLSTSTVMPDVPDVDNLDWYFKATKNNGIIRTGEVTTWTCIDTDGGLSGTIGPFAVGNWAFELVAVNHGATAPSTETYYDNGDWHYGLQVVYVGRNASVELEAANTSSDPKLIAIELERVNVPQTTEFKVNASSIKLLDGESDSFGSGTIYYTLVIGTGTNYTGVTEKTSVDVEASTTAYAPASPAAGYVYTPTTDGEIVEITLNLYESNDENAQVVKSATTSVAAFKGSVITITGSSDQIDAFATFDGNYEASVTTLNGLGNTTFYASFVDAFEHVSDGDVVKVLKNVELASTDCILVNNTVTLDLNGKTITGSHDPIFVLGSTTPTYQKSQEVLTHTGYLTVTGNGTITSSNYDIFVVFDDATLDILNGNYACYAIVANVNGGTFNCYGGSFTCTATSTTQLIQLNGAAVANVIGGSFTTPSNGAYGVLIMNASVLNLGSTTNEGPTFNTFRPCIATNGSLSNDVTINIYSGSYTANRNTSTDDDRSVIQLANANINKTQELNIYGGSFTHTDSQGSVFHLRYTSTIRININGGAYSCSNTLFTAYGKSDSGYPSADTVEVTVTTSAISRPQTLTMYPRTQSERDFVIVPE